MLFMIIYDEEEYMELQEERSKSDAFHVLESDSVYPTIYHLLRLFDSLRGFHKGYLDLTGRHPERYYLLQSQWNRFLGSFLALETEAQISPKFTSNGLPNTPIAADTERWARFQAKWRLPESISYSQVLLCTQRVLRELKQNPVPHFQMVGLTDLPGEILDHILSLATTAQAKALACTCHILNDIGQRHIFKIWQMRLHVPPYINPVNIEYSEIDIPALAFACRQDLEENAKFLLNSPHITTHIQRLCLTDEWWVSRRAQPHDNNPFVLSVDFYKSINHLYGIALKCAFRLSSLSLCNLELTIEMVRKIADIPTLHSLDLHLCRISKLVRRRLLLGSINLFTRISNLKIYMDSSFTETHSQWHALLLCPNIRTLALIQFGIGPFPFAPDPAFWSKVHLELLERLSLDNIDYDYMLMFTKSIATNPVHRNRSIERRGAHASRYDVDCGLHLTHFKLHLDWCIPDAEILALLAPLRREPLKVLVIEGLEDAGFSLFDGISEWFGKELIALTLVRRQNRNQHQNRRAFWPQTSWEYAQECFGPKKFSKLRHFCWNFWTEYWDATPSALVLFETDWSRNLSFQDKEGYAHRYPPDSTLPYHTPGSSSSYSSNMSNAYSATAIEDTPYFLDSHWMALPFAAHCKTLETFSLMDRSIDMVCHISREAPSGPSGGGRLDLRPRYYPPYPTMSGSGGSAGWDYYADTDIMEWNTPAGVGSGGAGWAGLPPLRTFSR
ncbi:hypothetical protein BJ165DRAFT_1404729 [Panaeolus papilionaceus]|nr:hypothetical protein BJ165DRAFT_1404729 [Panaeolus papilionaceus]